MSGSKKKKFDTATMRRVIGLVTPERGYLAAGLVFAAVNVALTLTAPILIGLAVDRVVGPGEVDFAGMTPILAALAAVALGGALAGWLMTLCTNTVTYRAVRRLRQALFDKFGALPIAAIDRQARGDLVSRMTNDVEQLATGLLQGFSQLFTGVLTILGTLAFMFRLHPPTALVVVVLTPPLPLCRELYREPHPRDVHRPGRGAGPDDRLCPGADRGAEGGAGLRQRGAQRGAV